MRLRTLFLPSWSKGAHRGIWLLGPLVLAAGCAVAPKAHQAADVSGFKAELAVVQTDIGKIEKTTNVDRYTFFGAVVVVPLVLSWLSMRMAKRHAGVEADRAKQTAMLHATCEARKHGYWEQRTMRLAEELETKRSQTRKESDK